MHCEGGVYFPHSEDYIAREIRRHGQPYEWPMLCDMYQRLSPGDWVVDVGANVGNHTKFLLEMGCRVIAVEPRPDIFKCLVKTVIESGLGYNCQLENVALGDCDGFAVVEEIHLDNSGATRLVRSDDGLPVTTLDRLVGDKPIKAIKLDVEGMEPDVLAGASETLAKRPLLYIEVTHSEVTVDGYEPIAQFGQSTLFEST